jgi:hypothetical protein
MHLIRIVTCGRHEKEGKRKGGVLLETNWVHPPPAFAFEERCSWRFACRRLIHKLDAAFPAFCNDDFKLPTVCLNDSSTINHVGHRIAACGRFHPCCELASTIATCICNRKLRLSTTTLACLPSASTTALAPDLQPSPATRHRSACACSWLSRLHVRSSNSNQ